MMSIFGSIGAARHDHLITHLSHGIRLNIITLSLLLDNEPHPDCPTLSMKNDLHRTFGEIFNHDISAFRAQLIEVQIYQSNRVDSLDWFRKLRFLEISNVPDLASLSKQRGIRSLKYDGEGQPIDTSGDRPVLTIPIIEKDTAPGDRSLRYLAVSWKWTGHNEQIPHGTDTTESFRYWIQRPGEPSHESSFPDGYMDRVIRVAQAHGITNIWIDRECIYQREGDGEKHPRDQELGVQVMDLVYQRATKAVGLLTTALMHQDEVDTLAILLNGDMFDSNSSEYPTLKPWVSTAKVQMLILRLLSDPRWSRAWIFQEDHISSYKMFLLVPCSEHIDKHKAFNFGDIPGELQVKVSLFREHVTLFCLAQPEEIKRWPATEILQKAKRYKTFNSLLLDSCPTTTYSVLVDICNRSLQKDEDRIALLANVLRFPTRLDIGEASPLIKTDTYSLSTALLALVLLNGEILWNYDDLPERILGHDLQSYLEYCEYLFNPPHNSKEQEFINHCRFMSPAITTKGIKTQGWVFELFHQDTSDSSARRNHCLDLTSQEEKALRKLSRDEIALSREPRSILNEVEQEIVELIICKLEYEWPGCSLAALMQRNLNVDRSPPPRDQEKAATTVFIKMMSALARALTEGTVLRLARLSTQSQSSPPSGIFVTPENGWATEDTDDPSSSVYVFTSWENPRNTSRQERLASLEVAIANGSESSAARDGLVDGALLRSYGWINGVWDARGESRSTFVFPLMGISEELEIEETQVEGSDTSNTNRKRKRDEDADGGE